MSYAAAIGGADWNWGVLRVIVARGEGRSRYMGVKFLGLAIACTAGVLIAYAAGIALTFMGAALAGSQAGDPLAGEGGATLVRSLVFGTLVLLQRAALGFAVAVLLRSQVAGVVVGIVLYIGEGILSTVLVAISFGSNAFQGLETHGSQWFQFLPFSIGDSVLSAAAPASVSGDIGRMLAGAGGAGTGGRWPWSSTSSVRSSSRWSPPSARRSPDGPRRRGARHDAGPPLPVPWAIA